MPPRRPVPPSHLTLASVTPQPQTAHGSLDANGARDRQPEIQPEASLRVLATSDLHANVMSFDYAANRPMHGHGLAQMASMIAAARAGHSCTLLLDNGDFLQGTALSDLATLPRRRRDHPVIAAMNTLGYDAAALGNHEFNFGLGLLRRVLSQARFPILSANVLTERADLVLDDETLAPPFVILDRVVTDQTGCRHPLRIGILGLTPPEVLIWDREHLHGRLQARTMVESARAWVPYMRRLGAEVVICLAHTGISDTPGQAGSEGQATALARIEGIDALVVGHSHRVFPHRGPHLDPLVQPAEGRIAGKPAVQPGHNGSHLGVLDLTLRRGPEGWEVAASEVRVNSVSEVVAGLPASVIRRHAAPLRQALQADHRAALEWTRRQIGRSALSMSTCFALVADTPVMRLLARAKVAHVRAALRGTPEADWPILGVGTPFRAGGRSGALNYTSLSAGALTVRHLFDIYPYPNSIVAHRASGAEVVEILERAAAQFRHLRPGGRDQVLIDPEVPVFAYASIIGLTYQIDLSQPARYDGRGILARPQAHRIRDLRLDGRPVQPGDRFVLASNNYRTGGTFGLPPTPPQDILAEDGTLCTAALRRFIESAGPITPELLGLDQPGWSLMPMPGTTALFDSGAMAEAHLAEAAGLRPEFLGLTEEGFRRYRLHL